MYILLTFDKYLSLSEPFYFDQSKLMTLYIMIRVLEVKESISLSTLYDVETDRTLEQQVCESQKLPSIQTNLSCFP